MPVYNAPELVEAYKASGKIPEIHKKFLQAYDDFVKPGQTIIDLGSSVGLLPAAMIDRGAKEVICVEGNCPQPNQINKGNMIWQAYHIKPENLHKFQTALYLFKPPVLTARRVIYEIEKTGALPEAVKMMRAFGVKQIILQGCVPVQNPTVRLWNADLEAAALAPHYKVKVKREHVIYLEAA